MTKSLVAGVVFLLATIALPASAGHRHHHNNDDYNGYGYRFVYTDDNGYRNRSDNQFENRYGGSYDYGRHFTANSYIDRYHGVRNHQRLCRQHRDVHRESLDLHDDDHDQGFYDREDHDATHELLNDAHDQWHSDYPGADYCSD